jgi:hypothetical protein
MKININKKKIIKWSLISLGGLIVISLLTSGGAKNDKSINGEQNKAQSVQASNQKDMGTDSIVAQPTSTPAQPTSTPAQPTSTPAQPTSTPAQPTSTPHYYTNIYGNSVQSPTSYNSQPAGATARCGDGTYSFSQNHSGTCSHHGGVAEWL